MPLDVVDVCDDDGVSGESLMEETALKPSPFFSSLFFKPPKTAKYTNGKLQRMPETVCQMHMRSCVSG
jgi:hypothetical protein